YVPFDFEEDESAPLISATRIITVGVVAGFVEWVVLLASMTLLPGLEAEVAAKGGMVVGAMVALYIVIYIGTYYLSIAHQLLQEAGRSQEPTVQLTDKERFTSLVEDYKKYSLQKLPPPIPVDNYAFLEDLVTIKSEYNGVLDINHRIQASTMSNLQKSRATEMMALVEEVIDTARLLHQLNKITPENTDVITHKINNFKEAMIAFIEKHANKLSSKFDNINMPDTYEKEDELERLRTRGAKLLAKIENDTTFDGSEDKFRLGKIIYNRLDELWHGYITAKKNYYEECNEDLLSIQGGSDTNPDVIIDKIFTDINNIYNDIENGVNSVNKKSTMNELLSNKNYFEQL
ncbi:MAG: hypothetical protein J6N72_10415, partial [Psychrobacter sp.]|nr:hypothetical protein [Psychrobacter sp.]